MRLAIEPQTARQHFIALALIELFHSNNAAAAKCEKRLETILEQELNARRRQPAD